MQPQEFLDKIKPSDEIVIVFNNDGDGIASCSLVMKFLEKTGRKKPYIISQPMPPDKNLIKRIQLSLPNKIIFLDMAMDQHDTVIKKLTGISDILIIDHHEISKDLNKGNVVYYNPRSVRKDIYQSTSYCAYKICSSMINMEDYMWIAAFGMVSDYDLNDSQDVVSDVRKKYKVDKLYESIFGRISDMIYSVSATNAMQCEEIVETIMKIEDPNGVFRVEKFVQSYNDVQNEITSILKDAESAEKINKIIFYKIKSKYGLSSVIATKLVEKWPDHTIIIYRQKDSVIKISARSNVVNIAQGLQRAAEGMKASAGGHERAAGATFPSNKLDVFKAKLVEAIS